MPRIHLKEPKGRQPKPREAVTLRCHWNGCGYEFTVSAEEAHKVRLCPNCVRPLNKKPRPDSRSGELVAIGAIDKKLTRRIKGPSPIITRLIEAAANDPTTAEPPLYLHSVFCQTSMPYRDPGDEVRTWRRVNGNVVMNIAAGEATDPETFEDIPLSLPFGPRARTIIMHINQRALLATSALVDVGDSLTQFVRRVLEIDPNGRNMRMVKEQLARLAACRMRLTFIEGPNHTRELKTDIIKDFDLWFPKDERQRVLWPSYVHLSEDYFKSLQAHAVPLDERHIAALAHSSMALDVYAWLAQRLHRIPPNKPAFVSWAALYAQFGQGYKQQDNFRRVFRVALKQVTTVYRAAHIEEDERGKRQAYRTTDGKLLIREPALGGLTLYNSLPPVPRKFFPMGGKD